MADAALDKIFATLDTSTSKLSARESGTTEFKESFNWASKDKYAKAMAASNGSHQYQDDVQAFIDAGFARKGHDLKSIRNILIGLMSSKPWEVLVGQGIATLVRTGGSAETPSLRDYLGTKVCTRLLGLAA